MPWYADYVYPRLIRLLGNPRPIRAIRQRLVPQATGAVLEIGVGTGANLPHYNPARVHKLYALEPNPRMVRTAERQPRPAKLAVEFLTLPGEEVPLEDNAVDIVRADVSWKAGVTGTLKIAHLAEAHGMRCEIHCTTMGFMDVANLHVSCAIKNCEYFELLVPEEAFRFPMKDQYPIDRCGIAHVPQKPGIGVELDWAAIDKTCVEHKKSPA